MNKSIKKILPFAFVIGFCILATIDLYNPNWGIFKEKPAPTPGPLAPDLAEMIDQYKKGEVSEIDISLLTTFTWDRFYVFGAYTDLSKLDSMFGNSWRDKCHVTVDYSDRVALLIFAQKDRVVDCVEYPTYENDFSGLQKYESGFLPDEARFVLDERGRAIWVGDK
jgi:hypothetical protein